MTKVVNERAQELMDTLKKVNGDIEKIKEIVNRMARRHNAPSFTIHSGMNNVALSSIASWQTISFMLDRLEAIKKEVTSELEELQ